MAARLGTTFVNVASLLLGMLAFPFAVVHSNGNRYPTISDISQWASDLDRRLTSSLENIVGMTTLDQIFTDLNKAKLVPINGAEMVHQLSAELTKYLQKKMDALQRLVKKAEDEVSRYKYDQTIQKGNVDWVSVKSFASENDSLEYSQKFKKGVNYSYSGVHIPLEIYEGYPEILNGLSWSGKLDEEFKRNLQDDPTLLWQYFGSQTGFMRMYPANRWKNNTEYPDLFDVRRRPWYIHGSSSPKDMLILLDISGSMHGQTMEIMKISVKTLLNTLGEDDFVNVAKFSNETEWVSCFTTFVQATRRNKLRLFEDIDKLKDGNMASLSIGLKFAFTEFENFERNRSEWEGANCHKVIVIFTDGGTEEAWDVLKKYNSDKKIRIFTFAVGPHPVPHATIKDIACQNKGYFSSVPSMGATRIRAQDYVKVLSRPMVLSNQKEFQWTNFYLDVSGLGVLTTVTLPVFNKSDPYNDTMVGVMGVDVTVQSLMEMEPRYKMGPGGYSFAINHNGLIVYHPDLAEQIENRVKRNNVYILDDSPHTDYLDLEVENEARNQIRSEMIDQRTGYKVVDGIIELPDLKHAVVSRLQYYYTPINQTQFSLGIAMLKSRTHCIQADEAKGLGLPKAERNEVLLAPWKYCHKEVLDTENMQNVFQNISITMKTDMRLCDNLLVHRMIWDLNRTRAVIDHWKKEDEKGRRTDVIATFISTEGGVTRIFPISEMENFRSLSNPRGGLYYERALYGADFVFLLPQLYANGSRVMITFVKAIRSQKNASGYAPGVVGGVVDENLLQSMLQSTPAGPIPGSKTKQHCSQTDTVLCYLLDDGGFVIASNQVDQPFVAGEFLADHDPALMHELYEKEIYKRVERYNHEDHCPKPRKVNAGNRVQVWSYYVIVDFLVWLWEIFFCLSSLFWPTAHSVPEFAIYVNDNRSCTTLMARYYIEKKQQYVSNFTCDGRTRHYSVASVGDTNLLLVVTNAAFLCSEKPAPVQAPREVETPDLCTPEVRYRRRPGKCFAHHPNDNNTECKSGAVLRFASCVVLLGSILVFLYNRVF